MDLQIIENEELSKKEILNEIKECLKELDLIKKGKLKSRPVKHLHDEL